MQAKHIILSVLPQMLVQQFGKVCTQVNFERISVHDELYLKYRRQ